MATTASQRGKLHRDFSSPTLNPWRMQRPIQPEMLAGERRSATRPPLPQIKDRVIGDGDGDGDGGFRELREKLLGELREAVDNIQFEMPPIGPPSPAPEKAGEPKVEEADRPWNLRLRTNAKRAPAAPAAPPAKPPERTMRLRSEGLEKMKKKKEKRRFSISLSREEIEEDLFALTGSRPKRRPKKRPRSVQLQLDGLFPGIGLSEITITPELYKVDE